MLLAACGGSGESEARELQKTQASWEATVQLTTDLWQRRAIRSKYARQTLEAAQQELEKTRQKAEKLSK